MTPRLAVIASIAMLDLIFAIKFVHVLAVTVMFGTWLCLAIFMVLAHRSGNTSVVALTSRLVVTVELTVVAAAIVLQPISGIPLAYAIGLDPLHEFWIVNSSLIYVGIVGLWIAAVRTERRIRDFTREAALEGKPLSGAYRRMFRLWCLLSVPIPIGMLVIYALMIWQPRFDG
ncbi:MAG: DUF2269 domain-containing protein [Xanthobacteraceae bacterium]